MNVSLLGINCATNTWSARWEFRCLSSDRFPERNRSSSPVCHSRSADSRCCCCCCCCFAQKSNNNKQTRTETPDVDQGRRARQRWALQAAIGGIKSRWEALSVVARSGGGSSSSGVVREREEEEEPRAELRRMCSPVCD